MRAWAIVLAAGRGSRLRSVLPDTRKQFVELDGLPLFWRSAACLAKVPLVKGVVFTFPEDEFENASALLARCAAQEPLGIPHIPTIGGERRQDSVYAGLAALPADCTHVLVHDSARPFITPALARRVLEPLSEGRPGVIPGQPLSDTVKEVDGRGVVLRTPDRACLRAVQTPQGFDRAVLAEAHARCRENGWQVTDDASLLERCGIEVLVVEGDPHNRKITNPEDLELLESRGNKENRVMTKLLPCVGVGYDVHSYGGNRPFILGGVRIESTDIAIKAHSDGDVLLHALIDALLGCCAAGDIGTLFPDSDAKFENISSSVLLAETLELVRREGVEITHVDLTVIAQAPKVAPFRKEIARNIAHLMQLDERSVNVKATTEEGLGFTGARQGIKAVAAVTGLRSA